jgi:hypothetical protein
MGFLLTSYAGLKRFTIEVVIWGRYRYLSHLIPSPSVLPRIKVKTPRKSRSSTHSLASGALDMAWVFLVLTIGSAIIAGKILLNFTGFLLAVQPLITQLQQQTLDLDLAAKSEADIQAQNRVRSAELRDWLVSARQKRDVLRCMLEAERV